MIMMCFDLSSVCIGVTFAQLKGITPIYVKTLAIIPESVSALDLGYTTKEPKKIHYNGNTFKGLLKPGETFTSKSTAKKRLAEFKNYSHRQLLKDIGKQCGFFLEKVKPDILAIEKNKSFNGILTTKLLAEIAGGLYFYSGMKDIPLYDIDESTIRAFIRKQIKDFSMYDGEAEKMAIDTKWEIYCRLRSYFEKEHPGILDFTKMTLDESDSLAVFYYLLKYELANKM